MGEFRQLSGLLDERCAQLGRDPREIERSVQVLVTSAASPAGGGQPGLPPIADGPAARDLLLAFIHAGAPHLVLAPVVRDIDRPVRCLADEIVEPVRAQLRQEGRRPAIRRAIDAKVGDPA